MSNPTEPIAVATAVAVDYDDDIPGRKAASGAAVAASDYYGAVDDRGGAGDAGGSSHRDADYVANYVAPASGTRWRYWRRSNVVAALAAVAVLLLLLRVLFPHGFCHHGRCRPWWWHHS